VPMLDAKEQYALAALVYMARRYDARHPEEPVRLEEIAQATGAPPTYLSTLLPRLKRVGAVGSIQGRTGGYHLLRPPERISVAEVLTALARRSRRRAGRFTIEAGCRRALDWLSDEMEATRRAALRQVSLADLAARL